MGLTNTFTCHCLYSHGFLKLIGSFFRSYQIISHTNECQFYRSPLQMRFFLCKISEIMTAQFWAKKLCFFVMMGQLLKKRCVQSRSTTNTGPHRWLEKNTNMPGWRTSCWLLPPPYHVYVFSAYLSSTYFWKACSNHHVTTSVVYATEQRLLQHFYGYYGLIEPSQNHWNKRSDNFILHLFHNKTCTGFGDKKKLHFW